MLRFLTIRVLQGAAVLAAMSVVLYVLIGLMPGDPVDQMIASDPRITPEDAARLRSLYGLDQPLWSRYLGWVQQVLGGELGYSRLYGAPVATVLTQALGRTLALLGPAFAVTLALALPAGLAAARRPGSGLDAAINFACFAGISIPSFWLALLLIMVFAVTLQWLPAGGIGPPGGGGGLLEALPYAVLPIVSLTLANVAGYTRYIRAGVRAALQFDYIRTARAKGCPERIVVWRHALPNAMIPIVTLIGLEFGTLFSGALVTETMFAWPGVGKLITDAVLGNDFNLALAGLLLATAMVLLGNLLADIGYAALDPRVTFEAKR